MTDAQLLEAYSSRQDDVAFGELMKRHGSLVYRACHRLLKDAHEAEDASQAVFVVLARKAGGLRKGDLAAWLYRVAHLVAAETVRKRMHRTGREEVYAVNAAIQLGEFSQDEIADPAVLGLVDTALLSLPERYRQAVILRYLQNHSEKDAARLVGCPLGTLSRRASEGMAMLRKRLAKLGMATSATALVSLLTSEASAAVPETLLPSILVAVKTAVATTATATTATTTAGMLAKGAMKAMFTAQVKTAVLLTAAAIAVGGAGVTAVMAVAKDQAKPAAQTTRTDPAAVVITPRTWNAWEAFDELDRKGGLRVAALGGLSYNELPLLVPVELRFVPVDGRKLIEAVAAAHGLKAVSVRDGQWVVLQEGVVDTEVDRVRKDLESNDTAVRRDAAWRAGWMRDVRGVPLLVKAARNIDAETARQAKVGLRRLGWEAVLAIDETAVDLTGADTDMWNNDGPRRQVAMKALWRLGGEKALPFIEKAFTNQTLRHADVSALGSVGGEKAMALLEKKLGDPDARVRDRAVRELGYMGGEHAVVLLEKAIADQDVNVRTSAAEVLGFVGGERALALIERAMADQNGMVRSHAVLGLGYLRGDKVLALLDKALADQDSWVRSTAAMVLGDVGGDHALRLMEKALVDQDKGVRERVVTVLGRRFGADRALPLLEKALADENVEVRRGGASALSSIGGTKARDLLLRRLAVEKDRNVCMGITARLRTGFPNDTAVAKAIKDYETANGPTSEAVPGFTGEVRWVDEPELRVPFLKTPPTIDGVMSLNEWGDASALSAFFDGGRDGAFTNLAVHQIQPQVYAGYDSTSLYFCFTTPIYPEGYPLKARGTMPDVIVHPEHGMSADDHMEIEIRPVEDLSSGYQRGLFSLDVNPIGTVADWYWIKSRGQDLRWNSGGTIRSKADGKRWVVEYAIPLKSLRYGDYDAKDEKGQPLVALPPRDGTAYRVWFACRIGDSFSAFDAHGWNTTKTKLILDSHSPAFQLNDLGPITDGQVDVQMTVKNHNIRSETVRIGFHVESTNGPVYSTYQSAEIPNGLLELRPGEQRKYWFRQDNLKLTPNNNVLWFDVRSAGLPGKTLFRTLLTKFQRTDGGATDQMAK